MAPKIYGSLASVINWLPVAIDAPSQASKLEINLNANDSKMCVLVIESLGLFIKLPILLKHSFTRDVKAVKIALTFVAENDRF